MLGKNIFISIVVAAGAALIVWQVGFETPGYGGVSDANAPRSEQKVSSPQAAPPSSERAKRPKPNARNRQQEPKSNARAKRQESKALPTQQVESVSAKPDRTRLNVSVDPNEPVDPNTQLEAINLQNVEMRLIIPKIAEWTGKTVIPDDQAMKLKITIYAPEFLPRAKALQKIYGALLMKGYVAEDSGETIYLKPAGSAKLGLVPTVLPGQALASIENREQVVQKFFKLNHYSPGQMAQIIQPLVSENSHVSADEGAGTLLVIDTVATLMRIEVIIAQFDMAQGEEIVTEIFEIRHRDPEGIVALLRVLLAKGPAPKATVSTQTSRPSSVASSRAKPRTTKRTPQSTPKGTATSVVVGSGAQTMTLLAEPRYNWIIARASADDLKEIRQWIERLDKAVPTVMAEDSLADIENKNQIVQRFIRLKSYSASQMVSIIHPLMGESAYATADDDAGTLLLIDTVENLMRVEAIIAHFDVVEAEDIIVQVFEIHHREPEEIVALLQTLFSAEQTSNKLAKKDARGRLPQRKLSSKGSITSVGGGASGKTLILIPEPRHKWIIAKASEEDLLGIAHWIQRLDTPMPTILAGEPLTGVENKNQIVQRFVTLENYSPSKMKEILTPMMGESGFVSGDEATGNLVLVDTVANLLRIEEVIARFDVAEAEDMIVRVFELSNREPDELIGLLDTMFSDGPVTPVRNAARPNLSRSSGRATSKFRLPSKKKGSGSVIADTGGNAVDLIAEPRQKWIIAKASEQDMEQIAHWIQRLDTPIPTILADEPLTGMENKNQVVQRFVRLQNYSPSKMKEILTPMMGESGFVSGDETTGNLVLVDTVANLLRIEEVIKRFDVADAEDTIVQVFELSNREPDELIGLLDAMFSDGPVAPVRNATSSNLSRSDRKATSRLRLPSKKTQSGSAIVGTGSSSVDLIAEPRQKWIIAKASEEVIEQIGQWIQRLDTPIPTILAGEPLTGVENKNQVVQRFVTLENYSPGKMIEILTPMMGESGYVSGDEATGSLLLVDTVANLLRIEEVITRFDVADAKDTVVQVFELRHREPDELIGLLEIMFSESPVRNSSSRNLSRSKLSAASKYRSPSRSGGAASVVVGTEGRSVDLIAEPRQKWIIAKASEQDIEQIAQWIQRLDTPIPTILAGEPLAGVENQNQVVQRFVTLENYSLGKMIEILTPMMGESGYVSGDEASGSLLLVDTVANLLRIEEVITRFDVADAEDTVVQVFELSNREPDDLIRLLEIMFSESPVRSSSSRNLSRSYRSPASKYRPPSNNNGATSVIVGTEGRSVDLISEPRQKWIVVKASTEDIQLIAQWIQKLDTPIPTVMAGDSLDAIENRNQIVQRFVELQNYSAGKMAEILTPMMSESGYVTGDEATGSLLIVDTVENLLRIEEVIVRFDVPESEHTHTKVFEIVHREPDEIIQLLESLIDDGTGTGNASRGVLSRNTRYSTGRRPSTSNSRSRSAGATSTIVGTSGKTVVLVPDTRQKLIVAKGSSADLDEIDMWIQRLDRAVPTLLSTQALVDIENKNQIVQKCIKLETFSPSRMADIILPLMSESGYLSADEITGNLLLIDTVESLMRIETVIAQFDVPEAEDTVTEILNVRNGDPYEIVQLVRMLFSDGNSRMPSSTARSAKYNASASRRNASSSNLYRGSSAVTGANSVLLGPSQTPVVLIPEPKRGWIIARASAEDMTTIRDWISKLDLQETIEKEYESVPITYADVQEVATHLNEALQQMPGTELETSVLVQALGQARQIVIFGRQDLREMVKKLIQEIDVPPGQFLTEHFKLDYADPDLIKKNIEDLYGPERMLTTQRPNSSRSGTGLSADTVKVISHIALKEVTVIASPDTMDKVRQQIKVWDIPIDVNAVKPRIIELHNSDTSQMVTLLTSLFSREAASSQFSVYDYLFGYGHEDKEKFMGPLYGQLTFEEVAGTKKIIVISTIPEAYDVVEDLIRKLDQAEMAEVPQVIKLKYRDPEALAMHLNAMFNESGTSAAIQLSERGLRDYSMDESQDNTNNPNNRNNTTNSNQSNNATEYRPWWTTGREAMGEAAISNVIGRARFIPDTYSRSILVLAPPEFMENIEQMITELDTPGKQVMIKVIIAQVDHRNMTSLGAQFSSDSTKWSTVDHENAITARNALGLLEKHGALVFGAGGDSGSSSQISVNTDISVLLDFLVKELDAQILNQQTLWTKDNEEAEFFKGQRVGFQTRVSISDTGGRATSDFAYEKVGMILRTRPSITPEMNVDMIINVVLSQLTSEIINSQRVRTEMDTTTNMIVDDGQTLMLGGMLFQEDSKTVRKVPLLGDLPLIGGLFRHKESVLANHELLIFVTPHVVDGTDGTSPEALAEIEQSKVRLSTIQDGLKKNRSQDQD